VVSVIGRGVGLLMVQFEMSDCHILQCPAT